MAVKVILGKERTKCLSIFEGRKSETTMAHKSEMYKYPVGITSQNEVCLLRRLKSRLEKDEISAGLQIRFSAPTRNPSPTDK